MERLGILAKYQATPKQDSHVHVEVYVQARGEQKIASQIVQFKPSTARDLAISKHADLLQAQLGTARDLANALLWKEEPEALPLFPAGDLEPSQLTDLISIGYNHSNFLQHLEKVTGSHELKTLCQQVQDAFQAIDVTAWPLKQQKQA